MNGLTRMGREAQGCAWASQAGAVLPNPFASELARDCEPPSPILLRKWPCIYLCIKIKMKTSGCDWPAKRGDVVKKHLQARLRVSFPQQIQHSHSESTPCFLSSYLTRSFPLISPCGPTSGCSTAHLPRCLVVYIRAIRG